MNTDRQQQITDLLKQAFEPTHLEVIDDSHKHRGHAGAKSGKGHFTVVISAQKLNDCSRLQAHKKIHAVLDDMLRSDIHALSIKIIK